MKKLIVRWLLKHLTRIDGQDEDHERQESISKKQQLEKENIVTPSNQDLQLENLESISTTEEETNNTATPSSSSKNKNSKKTKDEEYKTSRNKIIRGLTVFEKDPRDIRDVMELMEVPFVALSKKRTDPIIYESPNGKSRVKISCHTGHYLASIYDWDIILFVASKIQESLNNPGKDAPPRTVKVPRSELLKAIYKHDGKKDRKQMEASLARLQLTGIETTIHNEDYRYRGGFGFIDSWGYTERKDVKEFKITLSEWLYDLTCKKGSLLKIEPEYFKITSGIQRFLYRTARKHVGTKNEHWTFSIEALYQKSGSEQEFKKFKHDLRKVVEANNLLGYFLKWIEEGEKTFVRFISHKKAVRKMLLEDQPSNDPSN